MSEVTIEQLQTENEALKAKNAELLDELKTDKKSRATHELQERAQALEVEKEALQAELKKHTFDAPVDSIFREISGAGSIFRESFEKHFSIIQDEYEGRFWIHDKDGNPVYKTVQQGKYGNREEPRELTFNDIRDVIQDHSLAELDFFLPKPKGGGALGNNGSHYSRPAPVSEKPKEPSDNVPTFGMR